MHCVWCRWPHYFNRNPPGSTLTQPDVRRYNRTLSEALAKTYPDRPRLPKRATVRQAYGLGYPHYSNIPDTWYKLVLWNLTEYERVFYYDVDSQDSHSARTSRLHSVRCSH